MAKKFYAYFLQNDDKMGIVDNWEECKNIVLGKKSRYKSFSTKKECEEWLAAGANYEKKSEVKKEIQKTLCEGIYFDAGTGRGIGVESRVTDVLGNSLVNLNTLGYLSNEYGNVFLGKDRTNNYGELLALYLAINVANKLGHKHIFGDSNLVIYFWSKGIYKKDKLALETVELILRVIEARRDYELNGGVIEYISGDYNPADLGFHK